MKTKQINKNMNSKSSNNLMTINKSKNINSLIIINNTRGKIEKRRRRKNKTRKRRKNEIGK